METFCEPNEGSSGLATCLVSHPRLFSDGIEVGRPRRSLFALETLRSLESLFSRLSLGSGRSDGSLVTLLTLESLVTLGTDKSLRSGLALESLFALRSCEPLQSLRSNRSYGPDVAGITLVGGLVIFFNLFELQTIPLVHRTFGVLMVLLGIYRFVITRIRYHSRYVDIGDEKEKGSDE